MSSSQLCRMPENHLGRLRGAHSVSEEQCSRVTVVQWQALASRHCCRKGEQGQLLLAIVRTVSMKRPLIAITAALVLAISIGGCSTSPEPIELSADTILIDVRTPAEYDAGHLDGAQLLDLNGGEFAAALPTLDPEAAYAVYCKSGNRSGQAVAMMEDSGFDNVIDLGSITEAAASTQIEVVQ